MKTLIAILIFASLAGAQARYRYSRAGSGVLPDSRVTPGAVRTTSKANVCDTKAQQYRATSEALKRKVCAEYHAKDCPDPAKGEIDHLIPLTLGGADVLANLWWQPAPDYHIKDKLEVRMHALVCSGKLPLTEAQEEIRSDWNRAMEKYLLESSR